MGEGRGPEAPASRRGPPWGLVGMLGLVMMIESTLAGHDLDFTAPWHWDWRVVGKAATRPHKVAGKDVLFFGDSLVKFGVIPGVIKERSGRSSYNFALHTGQTSSSYFMLRRALRAGAKPSAVVLDLTPHMLAQGPETNQHLWAELLDPGEALDMARTMGQADFFTSTLLASVLTSYKERHDIRAEVMATLQGQTVSWRKRTPMFRRNWKVNDGAQLMGDSPAPTLNIEEWAGRLYGQWAPHPLNVAYLDRFLGLARSRSIPVYWLLPPILPEVQARTEATGFDAEYTRFVRQVAARFPGTTVIDARHAHFTADLFMDGAHVNRRGALRLSAALGDLLRDRPGSGWIAMDLDHSAPTGLAVEDVFQSAAFLQAEEEKARR